MGIIICPNCGGKVSDSRKDCPHCQYVFKAKKTCPDCNEECDQDAKICPTCGHEFIEEAPVNTEATQVTAEAPADQNQAASDNDANGTQAQAAPIPNNNQNMNNQYQNNGYYQNPNMNNQYPNNGYNQYPNNGYNQYPNNGYNQNPNMYNQYPNNGYNQNPNMYAPYPNKSQNRTYTSERPQIKNPKIVKIINIVSYGILLFVSLCLIGGMFGNVFSMFGEDITISYYFTGSIFTDYFTEGNSIGYAIFDMLIYVGMVACSIVFIVKSIIGFSKSFKATDVMNINGLLPFFMPVLLHLFSISMMTSVTNEYGYYVLFGFGSIFLVIAIIFYFLALTFNEVMVRIFTKEKVQSFVFGMVKIGCLYVAALTFFNITSSFAYQTIDTGYGYTYEVYMPLAGFLGGPYSYFSAIMSIFVAGIFMATVITGLLNKKGSPAGVITMLSVSFVCFITGFVVFGLAEGEYSASIGSYVLVIFTTILLVTAIIFSFLERNKKAYRQ